MKAFKRIGLLCILAALGISSLLFASTNGVVGSGPCKLHTRTKGKPDVCRLAFGSTSPTARTTVLNGNEDGSNRVSNAVIPINGVAVFQPPDLCKQVYRQEKTIAVSDTNTLVEELRSQPGTYVVQLIFDHDGVRRQSCNEGVHPHRKAFGASRYRYQDGMMSLA
jgi:hypothetical protein